MRIETWTSDHGGEEIHHFINGTQTYLFGFNRDLLGESLYADVLQRVHIRLGEIAQKESVDVGKKPL